MRRGRLPSADYVARYRSWLDRHPEVKRRIAQFTGQPAPVAPKVCATCGAPFDQYERSFLAPDSCINGHQRPSCAAGPENPEEES